MQPGNYQLTATDPGFAAAIYNDVVVEAGRTRDVTIQMKVGAATERVEVSAVSAQGGLLRLLSCARNSIIGMERQKDGEDTS